MHVVWEKRRLRDRLSVIQGLNEKSILRTRGNIIPLLERAIIPIYFLPLDGELSSTRTISLITLVKYEIHSQQMHKAFIANKSSSKYFFFLNVGSQYIHREI